MRYMTDHNKLIQDMEDHLEEMRIWCQNDAFLAGYLTAINDVGHAEVEKEE